MKPFFDFEARIIYSLDIENDDFNAAVNAITDAIESGSDVIRCGVYVSSTGSVCVTNDVSFEEMKISSGNDSIKLMDLLAEFPEQRFNIVILDKKLKVVQKICDLILENNLVERILISSLYSKTIKSVKSLAPDIAVSYSLMATIGIYTLYRFGVLIIKKQFMGDVIQTAEKIGPSFIGSQGFMRLMRAKGIRVQIFVDDSEEAISRLYDSGANGFISQNPGFVRNILVG